ncbi:MAG: hypothetical protein JWM46_510 [Candidatus Kaiserbacteria bacterium]|nr:hypothetical protein [Candidatus Kaiserbacteria bacterium]
MAALFCVSIMFLPHQTMAATAQSYCDSQGSTALGIRSQLTSNADGTYTCTVDADGQTQRTNLDQNGNIINNADGTGTTVDNVAGTQSYDAAGKRTDKSPTSCSGILTSILNPGVCITRALFAGIASFLIFIGVECLTASGLLFESVLNYTVVSFQTPMYASIATAVNNAWTVFRDISNILIIGFFTFIAISTILGITEYGAKKLLSRVLIVAVLINFSLLFTKLVIDGSNFTAFQFYSASISNADKSAGVKSDKDILAGSGANSTTQLTAPGIAGTFIQYLGVTGFADSYNAVRAAQEANDDASTGLVIGVLSFVFLIATALVFLYGSFILLARAILFIVLLVTSSLAFATYLIPKLSDNYGWSKWWSALLKNAILAPILMMMLWVTLTVSAGISATIGHAGTIGGLAQNPTASGNITALLNFVIILGLLFASFKLSSKFSSGIGGFNFAAMIPGLGLAMGARVAAFGGRQLLGRPAMAISNRMAEASKDGKRSDFSRQLFDFGSQRFKGVAKSDFNAMRSPLGNAVAAGTGLKVDALAGSKLGGFLGEQEKKAHAIAEQARRITPDKHEKEAADGKAIAEEIRKNVDLSTQHNRATEIHEGAKNEEQAAKNSLATTQDNHAQEMKALHTELERARHAADTGTGTQADADTAQQNIINARNRHAQAISEQTAKIKEASAAVTGTRGEVERIEDFGKVLAKARGTINENTRTASALAGDLARNRFTSVFYTERENEHLAHLADHEVGHQDKKKKFKDFAEAIQEAGGTTPAPAPAAEPAQADNHAAAPAAAADHPPAADNHGPAAH